MKLYKKMNGLLLAGLLAVSIVSPVCAQVQEKKETPTIEQGVVAQAKQLCIKTKNVVMGASKKVVAGLVLSVSILAIYMRRCLVSAARKKLAAAEEAARNRLAAAEEYAERLGANDPLLARANEAVTEAQEALDAFLEASGNANNSWQPAGSAEQDPEPGWLDRLIRNAARQANDLQERERHQQEELNLFANLEGQNLSEEIKQERERLQRDIGDYRLGQQEAKDILVNWHSDKVARELNAEKTERFNRYFQVARRKIDEYKEENRLAGAELARNRSMQHHDNNGLGEPDCNPLDDVD